MRCLFIVGGVLAGCSGASSTPDAQPDACFATFPAAEDCSDPCYDARGPQLVMELSPAELALAAPPAGSRPIRVALFASVAPQPQSPLTAWTRELAIERWATVLRDTNKIFAQCNMHLEIEAVQVISLPKRLLVFDANEPTSFGGHPPPGTPNPDLFDYEQNERLTPDALELFAYGKQVSSKNAISVFTVRELVYYSNQMLSPAGGLSNPPNIYHHADDYPYRNSVLLAPQYGVCGSLHGRMSAQALGQELGHMLLNTGGHVTLRDNLMNDGTLLTAEQCALMDENLTRLFGDAEVPDPGPPD